ncbi:MAG TPA: putative ABC exporter domain-containing protein [Pirellulales bacterium]|nr:putative ABC exporter domain-containing protein [Pirellulales bacterium]
MQRALWTLMKLRWRAAGRRLLRQGKTVRGVFALLVWLGMMSPLCCGFIGALVQSDALMAPARQFTCEFAPLGMFLMWLLALALSAGDKALVFSMAEVDFLFAAPFKRRDLIAYKILSSAPNVLLLALMFSIMGRFSYHFWIAGFVGLVLGIGFLQYSLVAWALTRQTVAERAYNLTRKLLLCGVLVAVAAGLGRALANRELTDWRGLAADFRESWAGSCLLAPFEVFSRAVTAERMFPDAAGWCLTGLAIDVALVVLVMSLDSNYLEAAANASRKRYEMAERVLRGNWSGMRKVRVKLRLPPPRWLAGAGPVAWRQTLHLLRTSVNLLNAALVAAGICVVVPLFHDTPGTRLAVWIVTDYLAGISLCFACFLPFGLRADVDRLDAFKAQPLPELATVVGELVPPAILMSLIEIVLLSAGAVIQAGQWLVVPAAVCFAPPANLLLIACDNLLFLLFPYRTAMGAAGDMQSAARQMLLMMLRVPVFMSLAGAVGGAGALAWVVTGESWPAFAAAAWFVLWCEVALLIAACTWAFRRFDVSLETPGE